jgi:hypothetical protein
VICKPFTGITEPVVVLDMGLVVLVEPFVTVTEGVDATETSSSTSPVPPLALEELPPLPSEFEPRVELELEIELEARVELVSPPLPPESDS